VKTPRLRYSVSLAAVALTAVLSSFLASADIPPSGSGGVKGNGALNRVAVWSGFSTLSSSASLTFDGTTLTNAAGNISDTGGFFTCSAGFPAGTCYYAPNGGAFQSGPGATLHLLSGQTDGASAVGARIGTATAFTTAGTKLAQFTNAGVEKAYVDLNGRLSFTLSTDTTLLGIANGATEATLPSCSAADSVLQYNTSTHAYSCVAQGASISAYSGPCQSGSASSSLCSTNDLAWPGGYISARTGATISGNATCSCLVAGSGTTYQLQLFDNGVATGSTATVSCTTAAGTDFAAAFGSVSTTAGHHYTASKHTNCTTTQPAGCACILQVTP
jgi:hypothetical protein